MLGGSRAITLLLVLVVGGALYWLATHYTSVSLGVPEAGLIAIPEAEKKVRQHNNKRQPKAPHMTHYPLHRECYASRTAEPRGYPSCVKFAQLRRSISRGREERLAGRAIGASSFPERIVHEYPAPETPLSKPETTDARHHRQNGPASGPWRGKL